MIGQAPGGSWVTQQIYRTQEKQQLRRDSNFIGAGMLALTFFMQLTFTGVLLLLALFGIVSPGALAGQEGAHFGLSANAYLVTYMLVYTIAMGFPLPLMALIFRRNIRPFGQRQRVRPGFFLCLIFLGMAICILANFITSYIMTYLEYFGVPQPEMPDLMEKEPVGLLLNILTICVLPAFLEEMVFRGYILQTLRPYGDGVALFVSALLFGLMHGNVLQIPFAFVVGLVLGFVVIRTNNIFVAIVIHFLNNFMSTMLDYAGYYLSDAALNVLTIVIFCLLAAVGGVAALVLYLRRSPVMQPTDAPRSLLSAGERASTVVLQSPVMLISVIVFILLTALSTFI